MATGEDQAEPVVLDVLELSGDGADGFRRQALGELRLRSVESGAAAHGVDSLEAPGGNEPGSWIGGRAVARPLLDRGREGVMQRLLGEVKAPEQADEGGQDAARLGPVDRSHRLAGVRNCR